MLSPADMLIIGAAALIFFGPDQLPKVARRAGQAIREVQNTSQSFIREMERAADASDVPTHTADAESLSPPYEYRSYAEPTPAPEAAPPMHDPTAATAPTAPLRSAVATPAASEPPAAAPAHDDGASI